MRDVSGSTFPDRARLVFGMVPQRDDERTRVLLSDLCAYLAQQTSLPVVPHRSPSSEALASALHAGRVHVAWTGALVTLLSPHMAEMIPILSAVRAGVALYHAVLFAPLDSPVHDLASARGKRVAWVAQSSAAGYVMPRLSLLRAGIDVSSYFSEEIFAGSHALAARATVNGQADLAATYAIFEDGDPHKPLAKSGFRTFDPNLAVRILDVSGPIPPDVIVAAPHVSAERRRLLCNAMLRIAAEPGAKEIMSDLIGADGFVPFAPGVLREARALVDAARDAGALR
jgi:phosphonate transport system substrate-binding protein